MANSHNMNSRQRRAARRALIARQGLVCHWCQKHMTEASATIDHLKPRSFKGRNAHELLVLAHRKCNLARATAILMAKRARTGGTNGN